MSQNTTTCRAVTAALATLVLGGVLALPAAPSAQSGKLKVHISVDMEGVAGAVTPISSGRRASSTGGSASS